MSDEWEELEADQVFPGWTEAELDLSTLDEALLPEGHRSGFVAVAGRPSVGKSTLINACLGQKVAIESPRLQTTRLRQLGILTEPDYQIVFVDTPGWHVPQHRLGEFMMETAARAIPDADLILFVVDISAPPGVEDRMLAESIAAHGGQAPILLALNKVDLIGQETLATHLDAYRILVPQADWVLLSATRGDNRDQLLQMIVERLPEGPRYYPADQVTDSRVRDVVGELIREQILHQLRDEVPHAVAVLVNEYKERSEGLVYVNATIFVEKDSQKGIVIGSKGRMLKQIGAAARGEIERALGVQVYLDLWVKVSPKWRRDDEALRQFGYSLPK